MEVIRLKADIKGDDKIPEKTQRRRQAMCVEGKMGLEVLE